MTSQPTTTLADQLRGIESALKRYANADAEVVRLLAGFRATPDMRDPNSPAENALALLPSLIERAWELERPVGNEEASALLSNFAAVNYEIGFADALKKRVPQGDLNYRDTHRQRLLSMLRSPSNLTDMTVGEEEAVAVMTPPAVARIMTTKRGDYWVTDAMSDGYRALIEAGYSIRKGVTA